jgi:hypothetical protein
MALIHPVLVLPVWLAPVLLVPPVLPVPQVLVLPVLPVPGSVPVSSLWRNRPEADRQ